MNDETIRRAEGSDTDAIVAIVAGAGLPVGGILEHAGEYFVAVRGSRVVGCCGLEIYGDHALLRSVAVTDAERGRGVGGRLVERALSHARELGLASVTLLTTTAPGYFPHFGFREVGRDEVPASVRDSEEFRSVCPSTATSMLLALGSAPGSHRASTT